MASLMHAMGYSPLTPPQLPAALWGMTPSAALGETYLCLLLVSLEKSIKGNQGGLWSRGRA